MKTIIQNTIITLFLATLSCSAAPPYIPAPVTNYTSVAWSPVNDTNVTAVNIHAYPPGGSGWILAASVPIPQTVAVGVLTNWPSGTAFVADATNATLGVEGPPSAQVTNNIVAAPAPVTGLQKQ